MLLHLRSKNAIAANPHLVPKSPISIILSAVRDYFSYCQDVVTLPKPFYFILTGYLLSVSIIPPLLLQNPKAWDQDSTLGKTLRFCSFFVRLSSIYTTNSQVIIDSIFNLAFIILFSLPLIIFSPIYKGNGRISKTFCILTTLCTDFLLYIVYFWTSSQIGTIIGLFITPRPGQNTLVLIILFVFLLLLLLILLLTFDAIFFPQVNYTLARTIVWVGKTMSYFYGYISILLILTRICEIIDNNIARNILILIYSIFMIGAIIIVFLSSPFISIKLSSIFVGGTISSLVILVFIMAHFTKETSDDLMRIILFFSLLFLISFVIYTFFRFREIKILLVLDYLNDDLVTFHDVFKQPYQFLLYMRVGFQNAHPYILSFMPFETALSKWPKYTYLWMNYLRFMAVYYEETAKMHETLELLKNQNFPEVHIKSFRALLVRTLNIRDRQMSSELKHQFKLLDDQIRLTKNLLVTYWSAIEECSPSSAFDIGKQVNENIQNIESMFSHLILLYPNNHHLSSKFANFFFSVVFDFKQGEYFKHRGTMLKDQRNFTVDIAQHFAFEMFPLLPKKLGDISIIMPPHSLSMTTDESFSTTFLEIYNEENEENDFESSRIRSLGLNAPIPFARNLIILGLVFTILAFCIGPFSPSFYVLNRVQTLQNYFKGVSSSCKVTELIEIISYYLLLESMRVDKIMVYNETYELPNRILRTLNSLTTESQNFGYFIETEIKIGSRSSINQLRPSVSFSPHTTTNGIRNNSTIPLTLREGIASLSGDFFLFSKEYSQTQESFFSADWLTEGVANSYKVATPLLEFIFDICKDIRAFVDEIYRNALAILIVFTFLCVLFLPIGIIMYHNIKHNWDSIITIMNSLPQSAIQNTITHFLHIQKAQLNDSQGDIEKQYTSTFIQMVSSRDVKNGLPIRILIALLVFNILLAVAIFLIQFFLIRYYFEEIVSVPFLLYSSSNAYVQFIHCAMLSTRCYALYKENPFWLDNRDVLIDLFNTSMNKMSDSLNDLLFIEIDDFGTGIMGKMNKVANGLFASNDGWTPLGESNDKFLAMPPFLTVNIIYEIISEVYQSVLNDHVDNLLSSSQFEQMIHFTLEHFHKDIFLNMSSNLASVFDSLIAELLIVIFLISVAILVIGLILQIFHNNQLYQILKTAKFCLSSLSMIDSHYISESPSILQLFSGNFSDVSNLDIDLFLNSLQKVEDYLNDSIFLIDENLNVVSINRTAEKQYELAGRSLGTINSFIKFENQEVMKSMADLLHKKIIKEASFETRVAKVKTEYPSSIEKVHLKLVNNGAQNNQLVLLIARQDISQAKLSEIRKINLEIEELKKAATPYHLDNKIDYKTSSVKIPVRNGISLYCICPEFSQAYYPESADHFSIIRSKYQHLFEIIEIAASQSSDACILKTFNSRFCICFNLFDQKYNLMEPVSEAIWVSSLMITECKKKDIIIKIGMAYDLYAITGMMSTHRLLFDYYGESRIVSTRLAQLADDNSLLIHSNLTDSISNEYGKKMVSKTVVDDGVTLECMQLTI